MYPITAGIVVETKELWDELTALTSGSLPIRLLFELSEVPPDWAAFLDRIDRVRPDVILLDVTELREPLEEVVQADSLHLSAQPAVFALHTSAEPDAILTALRAGVSEYLYPPLAGAAEGGAGAPGAKQREGRAKTAAGRQDHRHFFPPRAAAAPPRSPATWPPNWRGRTRQKSCWRIWICNPAWSGS